ncbi:MULTISPECIES: hypothetical protein [unclassified Rathayibacter]|uniref:hypothetical protein n=1 Tax=unclassified Rathayibacter TaxID=2609250 RepID=UPI00188D2FC1|nr:MULTISPECIES: hypothetical protein [unclassified Rathayibacter]MBF4463548.1 hypothetical protein [Rathayibacter sp. VKM Ac-2879]MBF4505002.1 hypothetical protein [Rathayibacter sp. VKM Ac-2878]
MSTSPDGAPPRQGSSAPRAAGAAPSRRSIRLSAEAGARRAAGAGGSRRAGRSTVATTTAGSLGRRHGAALSSILLGLIVIPISFFAWYAIISLGAYPGQQAVSDLILAVVYTAIVHALLLAGVLLGAGSIRARRRSGRIPVAGWIGVVVNLLVLVYWELLVSPWLVELWNRAVGS